MVWTSGVLINVIVGALLQMGIMGAGLDPDWQTHRRNEWVETRLLAV